MPNKIDTNHTVAHAFAIAFNAWCSGAIANGCIQFYSKQIEINVA